MKIYSSRDYSDLEQFADEESWVLCKLYNRDFTDWSFKFVNFIRERYYGWWVCHLYDLRDTYSSYINEDDFRDDLNKFYTIDYDRFSVRVPLVIYTTDELIEQVIEGGELV